MKKQNESKTQSEQGRDSAPEQQQLATATDSLTLALLLWQFSFTETALGNILDLFDPEGTPELWSQWEEASRSLAEAHASGDTHEVERLVTIRIDLQERCLLDQRLHGDVLTLAKQVRRTLERAQQQISDLVGEPAAATAAEVVGK